MATMERLSGVILKFKKGKISEEALKPEALFVENLGFDSLDFSELLVLVENEFGLELELDGLRQYTTLQSMVSYIDSRLAG
ncbi:MAG: phosphopantetheine-binding protein [Firmicutes bacterium]|nr:phosphopantetheine-binding protein [Bacillota bacterium]